MLLDYKEALLKGFLLSVGLLLATTILSLLLGTFLAIGGLSKNRPIRWMVVAYVEFWRNTPLLIQLIWIHFALPLVTGINTTALQSGLLGLTLNTTAYYTEIIRAGIQAVPGGQREAADSLGLSSYAKWTRVVLPQALRIIIPPLTGTIISVFKGTSILSILAVGELMRVANTISNFTFKPVEVITGVAGIYFLTGYILSYVGKIVERYFKRNETKNVL